MQLNNEYDFLVHFDLQQAIRSKDVPLDDIVDALKSCTNEEQIREIIVHGINFQFKQTNDFQIISNAYQQLNSTHYPTKKSNNTVTSTNTSKKSKTNSSTNVFQIENLICSIFSFLDFKSLLKCSRVNKQWLYDSYHPSSLTHIDTYQLYKVCHSQNLTSSPMVTYKSFYNINRYKKVESIQVNDWAPLLDGYFGNLEKFLNISKFTFDFGGNVNTMSKYCTTIMNKMIKNNKNTLTSITVRSYETQALSAVFLPRLEFLRLSGVTVEGLFLKRLSGSDGTVFNFDSSDEPVNKLKNVSIGYSQLNAEFWNDITDDNSDLSSITDLTLDECTIGGKNHKIIASQYIPQLARKLKNLTYFNCTRLFTNTIRGDRSGAQSTIILPVFLHHLSQNQRIRESLESLHICVTPQWFTNTIDSRIGDKFAFNFPNLKNVSISFRLWSISQMDTFENLNELQMMETILSLFCARKRVRNNINTQKQNTYVYPFIVCHFTQYLFICKMFVCVDITLTAMVIVKTGRPT